MKKKRIVLASVILGALIAAYVTTSLLLASSSLQVRLGNHIFATETMKIGILGDGDNKQIQFRTEKGEPIELVEPGMTLRGHFEVRNDSDFAVYYRLYFSKADGGLADVMTATIRNADGTIVFGPVSVRDMTTASAFTDPQPLGANASQALILELHYPSSAGNDTQNQSLSCCLSVDMTQQRNNPDKEFSPVEKVPDYTP